MLDKTSWKPDYDALLTWRVEELERLRADPEYRRGVVDHYRENPVVFMQDWAMTFDPRNAGVEGKLTSMPMVLFPKQVELVEAIYEALRADANLLIEKSRDMGATWVCVWVSIHLYLFQSGADVGWGSRKGEFVDKIGSMSSIFEKIRWALRSIPRPLMPPGWSEDCMAHMKVRRPEGAGSIVGECGDDIGRGGRTRIYFKDESAHYEHPELIEAALGDNTRVQIDISSVYGLGNVFYRKRKMATEWRGGTRMERGRQYCFIMDWRDHPLKDQEWYDTRRQDYEDKGLLHVLAQEVDRDYSAAVEGTIISATWIKSAIDAHLHPSQKHRLREWESGESMAGLDVADGGADRNAIAIRRGSILRRVEEWGAPDVGATTRRAIAMIERLAPVGLQYDCIGVGAGAKAEANRLEAEGLMPRGVRLVPWDAGSSPLGAKSEPPRRVIEGDNQSPAVGDFFGNLKAQGWWELRRRFERTHEAITKGTYFPVEDMISIDSTIPRLRSLEEELSQPTQRVPTGRMKYLVDKTPDGTRSPNMGDATMMCFWPAHSYFYDTTNDWVG